MPIQGGDTKSIEGGVGIHLRLNEAHLWSIQIRWVLDMVYPGTSKVVSLKIYPFGALRRVGRKSFIFGKKGIQDHCLANFASMIKGNKIEIELFEIDGPHVRLQRSRTHLRIRNYVIPHFLKAFNIHVRPSFVVDVKGFP